MPQVTFTIDGLAVCYRKPINSPFWTVVFPSDGHHKVNFTYTKGGLSSSPVSLANKNVTITAPNSNPPIDYKGAKFNRVLDLTASYLHNEGLRKKQNNSKWMIQHAVLDSLIERNDCFVIALQFNDPTSTQPTNSHTVADSVSSRIGGRIEIPRGGKIVIGIEGKPTIELVSGDSFEIDNYCGNCQRDFLQYHKLYENKGNARKLCDALTIKKFTFNKKEEPIVPLFGPPPAFCDGSQIGGDPGNLD